MIGQLFMLPKEYRRLSDQTLTGQQCLAGLVMPCQTGWGGEGVGIDEKGWFELGVGKGQKRGKKERVCMENDMRRDFCPNDHRCLISGV